MHQRFSIVINVAFEHVKLDIAKEQQVEIVFCCLLLVPPPPPPFCSHHPLVTVFSFLKPSQRVQIKTLETNTIFPVKITLCTLHYFRREDDVSHTLRHFMGTKILLTRRDQTEINQIEWETIANVFLQLKQFHSG